ncbi:hypothetical protein HDU97_002702 [Phlyctochytrium planicorne]|nr:hypothetical protein HDU97_002702 [Phlyctochytrium planicorne]
MNPTNVGFYHPNAKTPTLSLQIPQPPNTGSHASHLWPSSLILSKFLFAHPHAIANKIVLELGCGMALPGLLVAKMGAQKVILTDADGRKQHQDRTDGFKDGDGWMDGARKSALLNGVESLVEVVGLNWGDLGAASTIKDLDVVLGADVFYDPEQFDGLLATISMLLGNGKDGCRCIVAYEERSSRRSIQAGLEKWGLEAVGLIDREKVLRDAETGEGILVGDGSEVSWEKGLENVFLFMMKAKRREEKGI